MKCSKCGFKGDEEEFKCYSCDGGHYPCGCDCLDCEGTGISCPECNEYPYKKIKTKKKGEWK